MKCPSCQSSKLGPVKLEPSLPALSCLDCGGAVLDLVAYRLWLERHSHERTEQAEVEEEPATGTSALSCCRCSRVMLRYRYTRDSSHVLDICTHCDNVWIQNNEWPFLKKNSLVGQLPRIFTDPWQRALRMKRAEKTFKQDWEQRLGADLHLEVAELREWLIAHPKKAQILAYLMNEDPYAP
jgi:hypothetical protein